MREAGGLADLQAELRADGYGVDVVMAGWSGNRDPDPEVVAQAVEYVTDPDDPDRNFPVFGTTTTRISEVMDYRGDYPARCVLNPDRTIAWCGHGHGRIDEAREAAKDAWDAR